MRPILVISPTPTHPPTAGNRIRIFKLLEEFDRLGVPWHMVHVRLDEGDEEAMRRHWGAHRFESMPGDISPRTRNFWQKCVDKLRKKVGLTPYLWPYGVDDWCGNKVMTGVRDVASQLKPGAVWIEYVFLSRLFELFADDTSKILDTHDVFGGRDKLLRKQGIRPNWFFTTPAKEATGCVRADHVIAIQSKEAETFRRYGSNVHSIGHFVDVQTLMPQSDVGNTLIFIGSDNEVNRDALTFLIDEIMPKILRLVPDAVLEVYGRIGEVFAAKESPPSIRMFGRVDDLSAVYRRARVVAAPLRTGTGLKIKSIEALGYGKALVAMPHAAEGFENESDKVFLLAQNAQEFAQCAANALLDAELRHSLEANAIKFCEDWNQEQSNSLKRLLVTIGQLKNSESQPDNPSQGTLP